MAANVVTVSGSKVTLNGKTVTVVNQHRIGGTYGKQIAKNGCGACCTSMALGFMGKKVTPANVIVKGIALWGKWKKSCTLSGVGIETLIKKYGHKAKYYKVSKLNKPAIKKTIDKALKTGKPVICWTDDNGKKGDPFSNDEHYVLAVGYNKAGRVVVANSGKRGPVNIVTLESILKYLQEGNGKDKKWYNTVAASAGIIVVGPAPKPKITKPKIAKDVKKPATQSYPQYPMSTLKPGAHGQQVVVLQKLLGGLPAGGAFGAKTRAKVLEYQKKHKLPATGIVDAKMWESLLKK